MGTLFAVGALAACAMPPTQTGNMSGKPGLAHNSTMAPPGYDGAVPAASRALAGAQPLGTNIPDVSSFKQTGRASWYGRHFHGRRTANGERYDMNALTAAHKTLPLASYVRVTNTTNDKSVVVRINDRGPYVRGRVIDLSYAAARILDLQHVGTARVKIEGLTQDEAKAQRDDVVAAAGAPKDAAQQP